MNNYDAQNLEKLVQKDYIQHNSYIPTSRDAFIGLLPVLKEHKTQVENVRMLAGGNYVVMHNLWKNATPFGAEEMVAFEVIRIDENGLIAEYWHALMGKMLLNLSKTSLFDGKLRSKTWIRQQRIKPKHQRFMKF